MYKPYTITITMPEYVRKIEDLRKEQEAKEPFLKKTKEREKIDPLRKEYQKQAKERGVEELKNGDWMPVDGMTYSRWGFDQATYMKNTSLAAKQRRLDQLGTYSMMNGLVAVVDTRGVLRVGPATSENIHALTAAHFTEGKFPVPFALGEQPIDEAQKKELADMRARGKEAMLAEVKKKHHETFQEKAKQNGVKPVESGVWMEVDGITYQTIGGEQYTVEQNSNGYAISTKRIDQVGTYDANNGTLAYVNESGVLCIGAITEENVRALQRAGYRRDSLFVPFSNGERPVGELLYRRLKDVRTGKPEEIREAERTLLVEQRIAERKMLFGDAAVIPDKETVYNRVAYEEISLEGNTSALLEKIVHPKTERDDAGFSRAVYTYGDVNFSFKGREEMPLTRTAAHSRTTVLGEAPLLIPQEKYQQYLHTVEMTRMQKNTQEHIIANKTLTGVVELAQTLGSKDASLEQLKQEVKAGIYSERALALMDVLIATDMNVSAGGEVSNEGEPLMVLALLGNNDAQEALVRQMDILRAVRGHEQRIQGSEKKDVPPLPIQELVCVHATQFKPTQRADGLYEIPTTFDATHGKTLRNSVHTSLNHKVESHMYGGWEDAPYTVISPMDAMIQQNGLPEVLRSVDTWWVRNPGEQLAFPKAILVKPAEPDFSGTIEVRGAEIVFKDRNFTPKDFASIWEEMRFQEWGVKHGFAESISGIMQNFNDLRLEGRNQDGSLKWDGGKMWSVFVERFKSQEDVVNFFIQEGARRSVGFKELINELFTVTGMDAHIYGDEHTRQQNRDELVSFFEKNLQSFLYGTMNRLAVNEAITRLGCKVESGGMHGWSGPGSREKEAQLDALAYQLQLAIGQHTGTPQQRLTERQGLGVKTGLAEEQGAPRKIETFDWKKFQPSFGDLIGNLDQKSLRMLYASGLLVARENVEK